MVTEALEGLQAGYRARYVRFRLAHREEFDAIGMNPGKHSAGLVERLAHEFKHLPSGHSCSCFPCIPATRYHAASSCVLCVQYRQGLALGQDVAVEIGRTQPVNAPMPNVEMLDFARAQKATQRVRPEFKTAALLRHLNGESAA